jgi:hypothetical protein
MQNLLFHLTARKAELGIRLLALLITTCGGPSVAVYAVLIDKPALALGSVLAAGPLAVARLIPAPTVDAGHSSPNTEP